MADDLTPADSDMQLGPEDHNDDQHSVWRLVAAIALAIVVIVVVLLLLKTWRADDTGGKAGTSGGVITAAPKLEKQQRAVSLWVKPGTKVKDVLARNGYQSASVLNMGNGLYVATISDKNPEAAVEQLKQDPGLYDAGFVYVEQSAGK
ncbi:MAG: hypothetical protein Q8K89_05265 [Actinomycetota bacterium]|nr:hypothetical protein [Actinomycetota bacterium]